MDKGNLIRQDAQNGLRRDEHRAQRDAEEQGADKQNGVGKVGVFADHFFVHGLHGEHGEK